MRKGIISVLLLLLFFGIETINAQNNKEFSYKNPISNGIVGGIRDAQIINDGGKYFLIGTSFPFWPQEGKNPGVKIYSTTDLINWKFEKMLIDRNNLDSCAWYLDRFWAPELHKINSKYYLTFNCQNETSLTCKHGQACGIAVAENILGPYTVLTQDNPFSGGNDLTLFQDDDNKVYAFWNGAKRMFAAELDMKSMTPKEGTKSEIFYPTQGTWDGIGIEGPYCIKKDGTYFLFYSSWTRGYEIGYATAKNPLGPWVKYEGNPIYGGQTKSACEKNGVEFTDDENSAWSAVGHNGIWIGPDNQLWISCHGILKTEKTPYLVIDPIVFTNGKIVAKKPTSTVQVVKY